MTSCRGVNCRYIRSEGAGFLPGQASLAYFFLLGPLEEGSDSTAGGCVNSTLSREVTGTAAGSIGADKSTSGAGLGINGSPNFEAKVEEKSPEDADWDVKWDRDDSPISGGRPPYSPSPPDEADNERWNWFSLDIVPLVKVSLLIRYNVTKRKLVNTTN